MPPGPCTGPAPSIMQALSLLETHGRVILETESTPWADSPPNVAICRTIAARVGAMTAAIVEQGRLPLVVVFGGDTSAAVVHALGIHRLVPEAEIVPGVAVSRVLGRVPPLALVTKPGGYVYDDVVEAIEAWRSRRWRSG
jgi:uncharacterized protein YgbK (DUF1537 family)